MTGAAIDVRGLDGSPVDGAALADGLVSLVCRPSDVPVVRAAVQDADPGDLAALVATVDQHQPMALEVVVDVLAELGVAPSAVAEAMAVEEADVVALLGGPLGDSPAPRADADARIIEVAAPEPAGRGGPDGLDRSDSADPAPQPPGEPAPQPTGEPTRESSPDPAAGSGAASDGGASQPPEDPSGQGVPAVTVRIDEVAEAEAVARTVADLEDEAAGVDRSRVVWAVVLFLLVAGGVVAAAVVWWWP